MKFAILAFLAFWSAKFAAAAGSAAATVGEVNLKDLGFKLYGRHKETGSAAATSCPLGTLPERVFLHKSVKHGEHFFTWVKPVHGLVNKLVCGSHKVWEGAAGELLLDFHFFGKADDVKFVHLELLTALGGAAHAFLKFAAGASATAEVLGLAPFVAAVVDLMKKEFLGVNALPAHELLHHLAFHAGLGLKALPDAKAPAS
ncbi:conserved hypothetical protein [Theileria orientalis strain Shintoku]|uniref:Signal peptide containing protein n=1 Tax=Theileria orientalis strain Shintoku TaxID=869250 RepID=J4D966_THEOR|nr:conserved hypothetical protein [Theileria orientalis strain Shintoku]BAM41220.1 conserved hypothetical protein [Theileria orientalis strain Shintoku]|eukprot:XP_009691521.1 conserved hypothetical protein [Theileria orientalis strain Shintoku]